MKKTIQRVVRDAVKAATASVPKLGWSRTTVSMFRQAVPDCAVIVP